MNKWAKLKAKLFCSDNDAVSKFNIKADFLLPYSTSILQPTYQGIIKNAKLNSGCQLKKRLSRFKKLNFCNGECEIDLI